METNTTTEDLIRRFGSLWATGLAEQDRLPAADAAAAAGAHDVDAWVAKHRARAQDSHP